ncbi:MAG: hypothetical protein AAB017_04385 [Nitrospirota bacterium]
MFTEIIDGLIALVKGNLTVSIAAGLLILFIAYRSFKFFFKAMVILGIAGVVLYLILSMAATGSARKETLHERSLPENVTSLHLRL